MRRILPFFLKPIIWFRHTSKKKKIATVVGLVVLLVITLSFFNSNNSTNGYTFAKVEKSDIADIVSESGNIIANNNVNVYSPTTGIIEEIYVSNGVSVAEGEELFSVKSSATLQEKQAAYASYLAAKATLDAANSNANVLRSDMYTKWDKYRGMATSDKYESGGNPKTTEREAAEFQVAQDNWRAAEAKYKDQQTAISQGQALVNSAYQLYQATQNMKVVAPIAGTIANLSGSTGSTIRAQTPTLSSSPVLALANFGTTEIAISLTELDAVKVRIGQRAEIEVNAVADHTYKGIVRRVDDIGTNDNGVIKYNAYIEVFLPDGRLKPGMTTDVTIITKELQQVLSVPNAAVKPYQGGKAVRVLDENKQIKYIPVKIGIKGEERTQLLSGVGEGEEIIVSLSNDQIKRSGLF